MDAIGNPGIPCVASGDGVGDGDGSGDGVDSLTVSIGSTIKE